MLRAIAYFLVPVLIGVFVIPFGIWAAFGFPDGDSHGLWMPVMLAGSIGLPIGLLVGTVAAVVVLIRKNRKDRKAALTEIEPMTPLRPSNTFEKLE